MLKLDVVFLGFRFQFLDWHHASFLGTIANCTSTHCTGPQGSHQVLRLPSLELGQNAPVHTVLAYGGF